MHRGDVVCHGTVANWRSSPADPRSHGGSGRINVPISPKLGAYTYVLCIGDFIAAISKYCAKVGNQRQKRQKRHSITIWLSSCASLSFALVKHCSIGRVFAHACEVSGEAATFLEGLKHANLLWKVSHELFQGFS